jgi:hypothetical protein
MNILKSLFGRGDVRWNPADIQLARTNKQLEGLLGRWIENGDHDSALKEYADWESAVDQKTRSTLLLQITEKIEESSGWGWKAIFPFALADSSHSVVSTAAMNLAVVIPADSKDELRGLNVVCGIAESLGSSSTRAGSLLSGLLLLGDVRACMLVMKAWEGLDQGPRHVIASARTGLATRAHAIALLTWLEHEKDESVYGALAGSITPDGLRVIKEHIAEWCLGYFSPDSDFSVVMVENRISSFSTYALETFLMIPDPPEIEPEREPENFNDLTTTRPPR